jgi:hypothetical protein
MPRTDLTPYRKLEIATGTGDAITWLDVTMLLGTSEVKLEESYNEIDKLTFKLVHDVVLIQPTIKYGTQVRFTGGYVAEFPANTRVFFVGIVTGWALKLPDNGKPEMEIVAEDERSQMSLVRPGQISYPSIGVQEWGINAKRQWIYKDQLRISEIIRFLCDDYGIAVNEIRIDPAFDKPFGIANPDDGLTQGADESDFDLVLRLLTGVGRARDTRVRKGNASSLAAHACWFLEYDLDSEEAQLTVVPEQDILQDVNPLVFRYQGVGFQKVPEDEYDPTASVGEMMITNVTIRENMDIARNETTKHAKDVQRKAKGPKGRKTKVGDLVRGALEARAAKAAGEDDPGPDGLGKELDQDKIQATFGNNAALAAATLAKPLTYSDVEQFTRDKETKWTASSRRLGPDGDGTALRPQKEPPAGSDPVPTSPTTRAVGKQTKEPKTTKWKPVGERIKNYGKVVTFSTRGNIYIRARQLYTLEVPFDQYAGQYFLFKLTTVFGNQFRQTAEMGR